MSLMADMLLTVQDKLDDMQARGWPIKVGQTITVYARTATGHQHVTLMLDKATLAEWRADRKNLGCWTQTLLERVGLHVPLQVIRSWTVAQRKQAREWTASIWTLEDDGPHAVRWRRGRPKPKPRFLARYEVPS